MSSSVRLLSVSLCAVSVAITACGKKSSDEARAEQPGRPPAGSAVSADPAARAASSAARGGPPSGRSMSVTLAATDVTTVQKRSLERGVSITGDLRPIERIEIRARLEGDLLTLHAREGQRVSAGTLLARFEAYEQEGDRASAEADRVAAQSEVSTAQWNLEQSRELFKEGAIPERDLRAAEQQLASARARLAAANARLRTATNALSDTRIRAPVAGVIETRTVAPGEHVARGATMFTLVRNDMLELAAAVPASQAYDIKVGQTIRFSAGNRTVIGTVARISPTVDPASRALTVYVQVPNRDGALRAGTFATGRLVLATDSAVVAVPLAAIRTRADANAPFVYRIVAGVIDQATVRTGYIDDANGIAEIVEGLKPGDRIVVGNVGTLGRGMKVQIVGGEQGRR